MKKNKIFSRTNVGFAFLFFAILQIFNVLRLIFRDSIFYSSIFINIVFIIVNLFFIVFFALYLANLRKGKDKGEKK